MDGCAIFMVSSRSSLTVLLPTAVIIVLCAVSWNVLRFVVYISIYIYTYIYKFFYGSCILVVSFDSRCHVFSVLARLRFVRKDFRCPLPIYFPSSRPVIKRDIPRWFPVLPEISRLQGAPRYCIDRRSNRSTTSLRHSSRDECRVVECCCSRSVPAPRLWQRVCSPRSDLLEYPFWSCVPSSDTRVWWSSPLKRFLDYVLSLRSVIASPSIISKWSWRRVCTNV